MKIEMSISEIWDLLREGSTNQKNFIEHLEYGEFEEFIEYIEENYNNEFDLRGYLNGGVLSVETPEDVEDMEYIIYENGRVAITLK